MERAGAKNIPFQRNDAYRRSVAGESLTAALIAATYVTWATVTLYWREIPLPVLIPVAAYCLTLFSSLQHEVIHGHPTRNRRLNLSLVSLPLTLWIPLPVYESGHRAHHDSELTVPGVDPESWYVSQAHWARLAGPTRALLLFNNTLVGRLLVGPWLASWQLWRHLLAECRHDAATRRIVVAHALGVSAVLAWIVAVAGMPIWFYVLAFAWPGVSLSMVRAFVEHRYDDDPDRRTAIVRGGPLMRLAFLNNNFHWVHHRDPGLAWYRIPAAYARDADAVARANGNFGYAGYGEIARRYLLSTWTRPVFPGVESAGGEKRNVQALSTFSERAL